MNLTIGQLKEALRSQALRENDSGNVNREETQAIVPHKTQPQNIHRVFLSPVGTTPLMTQDQEAKFNRIRSSAVLRDIEKTNYAMPVAHGRVPNLDTWDDLEPGKRPCYNLRHLDSDAEIVELATSVFNSLHGGVTSRAICQLMLLAYNLKDAANNDLFGEVPHTLIGEADTDFDDISGNILLTANPTTVRNINLSEDDTEYFSKVAKAFCFLSASFMRLYTKSANNYTLIHNHLRLRFNNFYDFPYPLENYQPELDVVTSIKSQIDVNLVLRNTFYNFLYAGEDPQLPGKQLKEFLYGIHTAYTGMHSYVLFLKCMEAHKVTNIQLASTLANPVFDTELKAIAAIFNNLYSTSTSSDRARQMWRFARIFDNRFFVVLQTKNCPLFTAVLAHLYHIVVPATGNQNALNIAQIKTMTPTQSIWAKAIAVRAHSIMAKTLLSEDYKIVSDVLFGEGEAVQDQ